MRQFIRIGSTISILLLIVACNQDDNYAPISILAEADEAQVFQNATVTIDVLANDANVPSDGVLTINTSLNATLAVVDVNETPENVLDDEILYTPSGTYSGSDTFTYTVCDANGNCATADVVIEVLPASPVNFNLDEVPYTHLTDYNFFEGDLPNLAPVRGVIPYAPINSLFTDYAKKKRFIWMPNGAKGTYVSDTENLSFPDGTVLIKNFYYDQVQPNNARLVIETRLMIRRNSEWIFANYIWNEAQNEAILDLSGGAQYVEWLEDGELRTVNYRIPSEPKCFTCHKSNDTPLLIGLKPQNLNGSYSYSEGDKNMLQKLVEVGYLENTLPGVIETVTRWDDPTASLNDRVRGYFDINCASCHSDTGHCDYRPLRMAYMETADMSNMGVCVEPDTPIGPFDHIVDPGDTSNSVLFFRMNTTQEQYRMPLLGRTLIHDESITLVEEWINSLTNTCD